MAKYVDLRQSEGAKNATINRELACLKRMYSLGLHSTPPKVYRMPRFPMLVERNVRTGFVEDEQYEHLAMASGKIGLWMRALFECGYVYGWRVSELQNLRVKQVHLPSRTIRLEVGTTKNDEGREVLMTEKVYQLIGQCVDGKAENDYVFTRDKSKPIRDFRESWEKVCNEAGVGKLLFHDLRRTAARNLRRAGVAEGVIMKIGGWKTRSVFERYAVIAQSDVADAMQKLEAKKAQQTAERSHDGTDFGHSSVIVPDDQGALAKKSKVN